MIDIYWTIVNWATMLDLTIKKSSKILISVIFEFINSTKTIRNIIFIRYLISIDKIKRSSQFPYFSIQILLFQTLWSHLLNFRHNMIRNRWHLINLSSILSYRNLIHFLFWNWINCLNLLLFYLSDHRHTLCIHFPFNINY